MGTWSTWDRRLLWCHTSIAVWTPWCMPSCQGISDRRSSQPSVPVSREDTIPGATTITDKQLASAPRQDKPGAAVPSQVPRQICHHTQWHLTPSPADYTLLNPSHLPLLYLLLHHTQWTLNFKWASPWGVQNSLLPSQKSSLLPAPSVIISLLHSYIHSTPKNLLFSAFILPAPWLF